MTALLNPFVFGGNFAVVEGKQESTSSGTDPSFTFPSSIASGELLLAIIAADRGRFNVTFDSNAFEDVGWTTLGFDDSEADDEVSLALGYKTATGSESGSLSFTGVGDGSGINWSGIIYRISGAALTPEASLSTKSGGATYRPPALTPSWGLDDTLWIACAARSRTATFSSYPTDYSQGVEQSTGTGSNHVILMSAQRGERTATEQTASNFALVSGNSNARWAGATIGIEPA